MSSLMSRAERRAMTAALADTKPTGIAHPIDLVLYRYFDLPYRRGRFADQVRKVRAWASAARERTPLAEWLLSASILYDLRVLGVGSDGEEGG